MGTVSKINNLVERTDMAYVVLRTIPGNTEPHGMNELIDTLGQGFKPFAVTFWMEAPKTVSAVISGHPQQPIMAEKIWLVRTKLVEDTPPIDQNPNAS